MPITSYSDVLDAEYYEGQIISTERASIRTGINKQGGIFLFGKAVSIAPKTEGKAFDIFNCKYPSAAADKIIGISFKTDTFEKREGYSYIPADDAMGYPVDYLISYTIKGIVAVRSETAFTPASDVFVRITGNNAGSFRTAADATNTKQLSRCQWLGYGAAGSVGALEFDFMTGVA